MHVAHGLSCLGKQPENGCAWIGGYIDGPLTKGIPITGGNVSLHSDAKVHAYMLNVHQG
jgi:hypothetical protein